MEEKKQMHFRIRVGEIEVEASGPDEYIKDVREYADKLVSSSLTRMRTLGAVAPQRDTVLAEQMSSEVESLTLPSTQGELDKDESVAEFLERVPNRTHQDKILAFGYFLETNRNMDSFGIREINECYDEVKEAKSNTAQYFALLTKSGLIMRKKAGEGGGPTRYVLTRKGETTIRNGLGIKSSS